MRLLESRKTNKKGRSAGGTIFSIIFHSLIIFLAVFATARAGMRKPDKVQETKVSFVAMKKDEPPPPKKEPPPPKQAPKPKTPTPKVVEPQLPKDVPVAPPKGFKVLPPPVTVPTNLPAIDLSKALTNENDFSGKGVKGGTGNGVVGGIANTNQTYFEFQVEKPAEMLQDSPKPKYPSVLESSGIAGEVQAQFVVRSDGKADMDSFKVLKSTNDLFTQSVKNVLPRMHFSPAMIGGKPVNQLVQQSFQFAVPR